MNDTIPVFKSWAPEWLIRLALLLVILPGIVLFALSVSNANAAAGYYGVSPNDVQYSLIILYGSMASFVVLEGRFFKNIASKEYLIIGVLLLMGTCYWCYRTHSFFELLLCRYVQGSLTCGTINITLTLMFNRLKSERAREIGYSVVYCILLMVIPMSTLFTAAIIDAFNYNVIYKCAIYSYLPGALLMYVLLNNIRFHRRVPLYQLDWASFVLYSFGLGLLGYVLIYGQQYNWFDDRRITGSVLAIAVLALLFIIRQLHAKRPYIYLQVFKQANFTFGVFLLFVFYICRGSFGITTGYMAMLGLDPIHIGYLLLYNIAAIIASVVISSRLVLLKRPLRLIFIYGFILLLAFHVYMCFIFSTKVNTSDLIIPLILQGLGVGMLMVPIILFIIASSPVKYGNTGSAIGIFVRFTGFCSSIALINYFQLYGQRNHFNRFQDSLNGLNPIATQRLASYKQVLVGKGVPPDQAAKIANGLLNRSVGAQAQLRFAIDYYQLISWVLLGVLLLVVLFPSIKRSVINLKSNQPAPIVY